MSSLVINDETQDVSQLQGIQKLFYIWDALHDSVPFAQFTKREKHPWRSVNFKETAVLSLQLY